MNFKLTLSLIVTSLFLNTLCAQVSPDIWEKARTSGATQSQLDALMNPVQKEAPTIKEVKTTSDFEDRNVFSKEDSLLYKPASKDPNKKDKSAIFGTEIFNNKNLTFTPNYNMPTPKDYVLAAGDQLNIEVWGNSEMNIKRTVSSEGSINIENVGPINVNGLTIEEAEKRIKSKLGVIIEGIGYSTQVKVSLGKIRSIKVNMAGEVENPGTYTLPSLATLFNAIYCAGGVNEIGSLREIKVYRASKLIANLDVYDYIINGKYETNIRLEDNDMVIVSPYVNHVTICGKVKRERIFEMKKNESVEKLIEYAGGFKGEAYTDNVNIVRKSGRMYQILTIEKEDFASTPTTDGDSVTVGEIVNEYANRLTINGAVMRPGEYELSPKLSTLAQLIAKAEGVTGGEFATRGLIKRTRPDKTKEAISFDVTKILNGTDNITLVADDDVLIPKVIDLTEHQYITIIGEVNRPDTIEFYHNLTISDVIVMAGGLKEAASIAKVSVSRRIKEPGSKEFTSKKAEIFTLEISSDLNLNDRANMFKLEPFDEIVIRRSPAYSAQKNVLITGEVLFEGSYTIGNNGARLSDLIEKSGGLTPEAYVKGANLKRRMTENEVAKLESMIRIANNSKGKDSLSMDLLNIEKEYAVGIDLEKAMKTKGGINDIVLKEGDVLYVPQMNNTVKISGNVLYSNTATFEGKNLKQYISQAGGYGDRARKRPFVVYMNGSVKSTKSYFFFKSYPNIEPGAEVIVPTKQNRSKMGVTDIMSLSMNALSSAAIISTLLK